MGASDVFRVLRKTCAFMTGRISSVCKRKPGPGSPSAQRRPPFRMLLLEPVARTKRWTKHLYPGWRRICFEGRIHLRMPFLWSRLFRVGYASVRVHLQRLHLTRPHQEEAKVELLKLLSPHPHINEAGFHTGGLKDMLRLNSRCK